MDYYDYEDDDEKCESCGAHWLDFIDDGRLLCIDDDGRLLCTDCFFENQCEEMFREDDSEW